MPLVTTDLPSHLYKLPHMKYFLKTIQCGVAPSFLKKSSVYLEYFHIIIVIRLALLFQFFRLWLASFCIQCKNKVNLTCCLLELQLNGRRWWYQTVVMTDQIQLSLELSS